MGIFSKLFGSGPKPGFQNPNIKEANQLLFDRQKGALGNIANPVEYKLGDSRYGMNDPTLKAFQYRMPQAIDSEKGFFSDMMGTLGSNLMRTQKGAVDQTLRNAQLTGSYNPAMAKEVTDDAIRRTNEQIGEFGTKGALDLAKERAGYEMGMQKNQAEEDRATRAQGLAGEELGLRADESSKKYFLELLQQLFQTQIDPYAGAKGNQPGSKGILPSIFDTVGSAVSVISPFKAAFGKSG